MSAGDLLNGIYVLSGLLFAMGAWVAGMQFGQNQLRKDVDKLQKDAETEAKRREIDVRWQERVDMKFDAITGKLDQIGKTLEQQKQ